MHQSHFIEIGGTLIGGAITTAAGHRFRAVHPGVASLDGSQWPSLATLRAEAGRLVMGYNGGASFADTAGDSANQAEAGPRIRLQVVSPRKVTTRKPRARKAASPHS